MLPSEQLGQELGRQQETLTKINEFITKDKGETAKKFLQDMVKLQSWLQKQKTFFAGYSKDREALKQLELLKSRKPESKHLSQLNLDINPKISQTKLEAVKSREKLYESLRSSETDLPLSTNERAQLLNQTMEWCENLGIKPPNLETLLFPDMTYSVPETDLKNTDLPINFNPVEASITLSQISARISNAYINKYGRLK